MTDKLSSSARKGWANGARPQLKLRVEAQLELQ